MEYLQVGPVLRRRLGGLTVSRQDSGPNIRTRYSLQTMTYFVSAEYKRTEWCMALASHERKPDATRQPKPPDMQVCATELTDSQSAAQTPSLFDFVTRTRKQRL